mgnify:CR=1 FL=1
MPSGKPLGILLLQFLPDAGLVRCRVAVCLAVINTAAGDVAEGLAPATVVIQILCKVVVVIMGVKNMQLPFFKTAVAV